MLPVKKARESVEALVQQARIAGADAADALYVGSESQSVQVRLGELEHVDRSEGEEMGLRVFVGQRKDPFVVNLGETFDLVNIKYPAVELNPLAEFATVDSLGDANVTSLVLEVPNGMGDDKVGYHRWALESAALDLALRQRGTDLASLVGEQWQPVRVSLSMGLCSPPSADVVRANHPSVLNRS